MTLKEIRRHFAARRKGVTTGWEPTRVGEYQNGSFAAQRTGAAVEMGGTDVR